MYNAYRMMQVQSILLVLLYKYAYLPSFTYFPLDLGTGIMSILFTAPRYWLNAFETWNPFSHKNLSLMAGFLSYPALVLISYINF